MSFVYEEDLFMLVPMLLSGIPTMLLNIAMYIMSAYALYTIAQRRGLHKAWLAWIPVVNCWILGSLSDQYQYLVKGENKSKRKILLVLNVLLLVLSMTVAVLAVILAAGLFLADTPSQMHSNMMGPAMAILGICVPLMGIAISAIVIRYMALFDVYRSMDPANSILFLVLSILLHVTEPFFLFFSRTKDSGMPPRKQPVYVPEPPAQYWEEAEGKDYL